MPNPPRPMLDQMLGPHFANVIRHLLHGARVPSVHVASAHPALGLAYPAAVLACGLLAAGAWWVLHHDWQFAAERLTGLVDPRVRRERGQWEQMTKKVWPAPEKKLGKMRGDKTPVVEAVGGHHTPSGTTLLIRFDNGAHFPWLEKVTDQVAATIDCPVELKEIYDGARLRPRYCWANLQRRDILGGELPWPWMDRPSTNFFGPIPAGYDLNGNPVTIDLRERNVLAGGEQGSGKSWWVHTIVAAAMLDKRVRVHILDGKMGSGFRVWRPSCASFATNDPDDRAKVDGILAMLEARVNKIYKAYEATQRTIDWDTVEVADLLVLDEYTAFDASIVRPLMNLIARGRAAGLMIVVTTQRPSSQIMKTDFRELFQCRAAFYLDPNGCLMVLGASYRGFDSSKFSGECPGEMWLIPDDRKPVHCRGYSLKDSDLAILAARSTCARAKTPKDVTEQSQETAPQAGSSNLEPPQEVPEPESLPTVSPALLPTLEAIAKLGPDVPGPRLGEYLEVAPDAMTYRKKTLTAIGLVTCRSEPPQPGAPPAGRSPWLWSLTDLGKAVLAHSEQSQADAARKEPAP